MAEVVMNQVTVVFESYRLNNDRYIPHPNHGLNGRKYTGAKVVYDIRDVDCNGVKRTLHFIQINNGEPIECELVKVKSLKDGTLLLGICQQWD
jgi:hypothetical protein